MQSRLRILLALSLVAAGSVAVARTAEEVVAILNKKDSSTKIGCQNGTTGGIYIDGDADDPDGYGFPGLSVTKMAYDYASLAAVAMVNGEIDYVIVDNAPAHAIAKSLNG